MDELERTAAHARAYQELSQSWQARAERAEAAIQRVRELASAFGAADCDGCNAGDIVTDILAALDSTETVEAAPEERADG